MNNVPGGEEKVLEVQGLTKTFDEAGKRSVRQRALNPTEDIALLNLAAEAE
jgi:hypothetical protein